MGTVEFPLDVPTTLVRVIRRPTGDGGITETSLFTGKVNDQTVYWISQNIDGRDERVFLRPEEWDELHQAFQDIRQRPA